MKQRYILALMLLSMCCTAFSCAGSKSDGLQPSTAGSDITESTEAPYEAEGMVFSAKSGFYDSDFYLSVTADEDYQIFYTLDGSIPTAQSSRYTEPIKITDRSAETNVLSAHTDIAQPVELAKDFKPRDAVDKATVVRAIAIDKNGNKSKVVSNTYFVGFDKKANYYKNFRLVSILTDESNLFDHEKGIYVLGKTYDDWKKNDYDPTTPDWFIPANYTQKGKGWERQAAVQFFENGELAAAQDVGIRIHGGATRSYSQKSFNIYARGGYGAPKLEYDLFSGKVMSKSVGKPVTVFDTFVLRNGGNDAMYTRFSDKLIQSLVSDRQFLTQGMEPCIVFIDGEFWGHYEITEKMDDDFISSHYGVPARDVCIVKRETLDDGSEETFAEWEELRQWINYTDLSSDWAYEQLCEKVDMQSFMDYVSTEIYINNSDWGSKNVAMWKSEVVDENNPYADGKWRFVMFDTEYSSGIYGEAQPSEDSFAKLLESDCFIADLFSGAMENAGFRQQFSDTFMEIADKNFASDKVKAEIDRLAEEYHDIVIATYDRFWSGLIGGYGAESNYSSAVDTLRSFYNKRHDYIVGHMKKYME